MKDCDKCKFHEHLSCMECEMIWCNFWEDYGNSYGTLPILDFEECTKFEELK